MVLNIINKQVAHTLKESLFYGLHEATSFSWHAQKGNATVSAAHPPTELQKSHSMGMGAPSYLQFKGTALSQKFNIITGDVFLSEKWAIQSSAGEKRWLKRGKKKDGKKSQNCGNNLCISIPQLLHLSIGIQKHLGQHLKVNNVHRAIWTKLQAKIKA